MPDRFRHLLQRVFRFTAAGLLAGALLTTSTPALATQRHAGVEGVWVHQLAHLFFLFSMLLLIYWLRRAGLVKEPGWRYIQYAALFFTLWNGNAFLVHFLDEQINAIHMEHLDGWQIHITAAGDRTWLAVLYYLIKLDHLLCVPAMICLWMGLRHMLKEAPPAESIERYR